MLEDHALAELAELRIVPLEILQQLTPLARSIRERSRASGELVLKRDIGDGRRDVPEREPRAVIAYARKMGTVVFHPIGEGGHVNPTLNLARKLHAVGHRIVYLAECAMQDVIEREGFEFLPYLAEAYPKDSVAVADQEWFHRKVLAMWDELVTGRLERQLASVGPSIILGDDGRMETCLAAHRLKVPYVRVCTSFPSHFDPQVPPRWSDAMPGELSPLQLEREWRCYHAIGWRLPLVDPKSSPCLHAETYREIARSGVHVAQYVEMVGMGDMIDGEAELVLSSARLDFPRDPWPDRCYAGPCLTDAAPEPWSHPARRPGVPLVYCAFGGQAFRYPRVRQFLELLAEVVAQRNIDVILAADEELVRGIALPPAIHRMAWAPQRSILQGADLFVTHGGLSSIKEALWEGVPMLVVPQAYDQHGNAARVVFHGLGDRIVEDLPTAPQLATMLDGLLTSGAIKSAAGRMKELLRQDAMEEPGVAFVTELMAGRQLAVAPGDFERLLKRISWQSGVTTERP